MSNLGEYYLHENGSLIYKPHGGVDQSSTLVRRVWSADLIGQTPDTFIEFLAQAWAAGAFKTEIYRIANHNQLSTYRPHWEHEVCCWCKLL